MAGPTDLIRHIESYVDTSCSPSQQAASLNSIITLVKNDLLTIEVLVKEMGMYLTTTDNVIRARGILLLAEVLTGLASKPLDTATIHSLIGFFTDRLADWRALRGALVGCLALLRRKASAGMVCASDAKVVAQTYVESLQVQALGQHDRKLCFELLQCLLVRHPNEVASLGETFFYGICQAMDGEKDPHCLMLTFPIVEALVQIYPDPSGSLESFCEDLFTLLGCYFPIHFTHLKDEDSDVKRDDLSKALMSALSSTPLFEPFVIPLLLEKLSSSLPLAKVDSLKYLNHCTAKYGADRMAKHAETIWISVKHAISNSLEKPAISFTEEPLYGLGFQENEVATEALMLLEKVTMQNEVLFVNLIVRDEDINAVFNSIASYENYNIPLQGKQRLHAVGRILYKITKTSAASCKSVFESFFPCLMNTLEISVRNSSGDCSLNENSFSSKRFNFGALYLSVELIEACRDLIMRFKDLAPKPDTTHATCCYMLQSFADSLIIAFCSSLATHLNEVHGAEIYFTVKGLQMLATFPGDILPISKIIFENILTELMSIILVDFNKTLLWKLALKALVHIGSFVDAYHESEKALSYIDLVVEKTLSLVSHDDFNVPFPLKLETVSEIGASGLNHMLKIVQGLEEAIVGKLSDYVHGKLNLAEGTIQLLECYCNKILPWIKETGGLEEVLLRFVINIWNATESCKDFSIQVQEEELLDAAMMAMKLAVGSCSDESQKIMVDKAYSVLSSNISIPFKESMDATSSIQLQELHVSEQRDTFSHRDEWIVSLFASIIIAVHPKTQIANLKGLLHLFMTTLLKGCVPVAQALGSVINKLGTKSKDTENSKDCTLEEAIDMIFGTNIWSFNENGVLKTSGTSNGIKVSLTDLCLGFSSNKQLQVRALVGLAWIGKGLLLLGHEKVKDVTKIFLECLLSEGRKRAMELQQGLENSYEQHSVMRTAADAFHILMSDSEVCLNRKFHAITRPLYKQRFFSSVMPILQSMIINSDSSLSRYMLVRASAHLISNAPLIAILSEAEKLMPIMLDGLSVLSEDILDKDKLYSLLLVLSGILTDKNGKVAVVENAHILINCLTRLIGYPHMMLVRETAIQCLVATSELPYARIFPMRTQVLQAISKALNDPKRAVRQEAVRVIDFSKATSTNRIVQ
ncbi:hypothetical protein ACFX11_046614 [Malus domestica]